ncbi:MAG: hypothetical protein PUG60_13070 [Lachnospiraceae bacterium]|nr:hypothetical protein [Lachnospiraceae bacterium]
MGNFNFYINVDQCLNMSNFDMFFYRLQKNRQFHLSNVHFYDDEGEYSLKNALQSIHSFMEEHPYDVENFKIILGMRQIYHEQREWKDSTLYKLLKLYYSLWDNKLFIQSKDNTRRNVSMIMLMESDMSHRHTAIREFSYSDDVLLLIKTLGLDRLHKLALERTADTGTDGKKGTDAETYTKKIEEWLFQQFERLIYFNETSVEDNADLSDKMIEIFRDARKMLDQDTVTDRFLHQYLENYVWMPEEESVQDYEERPVYASPRPDFYDEFGVEEEEKTQEAAGNPDQKELSKRALWDFMISSIVDFAQSLTGHYDVFQKELDRNSRANRQLALLSVVEYITAEIRNTNYSGVLDKHENLDEENRRNWEQANNDTQLRQRYGFMLRSYKEELLSELQRLNSQIESIESHTILPEYEVPETIVHSDSGNDADSYDGTIDDLLENFRRQGRNKNNALEIWSDTSDRIEDKINSMESELEEYAQDLTDSYKYQLDQRRLNQRKTIDLCSQNVVEERIRATEKEKQKILEALNAPNMSMSIRFQDQLNALQSLEKNGKEIEHYLNCQKGIRAGSFLFLVMLVTGVMFFQMITLQNIISGTGEMILESMGFLLLVFLMLLFAWRAPIEYYYDKSMNAVDHLEDDLEEFLTGYIQKQRQFDEYINSLNRLDAVNSYLELLEKIRYISSLKSKKLLWHKVKICEHLDKLTYFDQMIDDVAYDSSYRKTRKSYALDENEDVIHNSLYWPQGETEV